MEISVTINKGQAVLSLKGRLDTAATAQAVADIDSQFGTAHPHGFGQALQQFQGCGV